MKTLETPRLILRSFKHTDVDDLYHYASKPNIGPMAGWPPHITPDISMQVLNSFIAQNEVWAIVDKKTNHVIGSVGIHPDSKRSHPHVRSLGYVLDDEYWGQGLMKEVVDTVLDYMFFNTDIDIISVYHYDFNTQSQRVIKKCHFKFEGILRQSVAHFKYGTLDTYCYSLTKEEYMKSHT